MPLNSSHLPDSVLAILRELPEDKDHCDVIPYQTKVQIYDTKCKRCQFLRIEAQPENSWNGNHIKVFDNIEAAIQHATFKSCRLKRQCSYPHDIVKRNGKNIYPNLTEIVSNSCEFWNENKIYDDINETSNFIELDNAEGLIGLPEIRCI